MGDGGYELFGVGEQWGLKFAQNGFNSHEGIQGGNPRESGGFAVLTFKYVIENGQFLNSENSALSINAYLRASCI